MKKLTKKMAKITQFGKKVSVILAMLTLPLMAQAQQTVSVSNYPLLLLSNAVTEGTPPAQLLLSKGDVGHHGELSPSSVRLINESRFVVWFGQELEQNLVNHLQKAPHAISLYRLNAFHRLPLRNIDGTPQPDSFDAHFWLDPDNAKAIVRALTVIHSHANPEHKERYLTNAQNFSKKLDTAVLSVQTKSPKPYWAYHDAYQYLEKSAKLSFIGALTPDHHLAPKASQIKWLSQNRPQKQMCLLAQMPVSDGIVNKLGDTKVTVQQEDMSGHTDFVQAWQELVTQIHACTG